jgi:hypothetical protein
MRGIPVLTSWYLGVLAKQGKPVENVPHSQGSPWWRVVER